MAGNEVTVTVSGGSTTTVTVPGSTGAPAPTITNGGTANVSVTSVGDRGPQGDVGPATTLTIGTVTGGATAAATLTGPAGAQVLSLTLPKGDKGDTGANVELQTTSTHLQWRPVGGTTWTNLVALTAITGPQGSTGAAGTNGTNGSSVELQATSTHIQWRLVGGTTWTNLIALTAITGPQGSAGPANSLAIGTVTTGAAGSSASATITGTAPAQTLNLTIPRGDAGTAGVSWQPVPMSPSATGTAGQIAYDDSFFYVRSADGWRRVAIASWTPLGAPTGVTATAGELQASLSWTAPADNGGYAITDYAVQYSINGGTTWTTFADGASTTTSATVTGLSGGVPHIFRVAAVNSVGTGPYSTSSSGVTPTGSSGGDPSFANVSLLLHMDGTGSTFTDSSGTPKTITANGNVTQSTAQSKFGGKSALFDGSGDSLSATLASFNWSADFTVEMWVRVASGGGYFTLFEAGGQGSTVGGLHLYLDQSPTRAIFFDNSEGYAAPAGLVSPGTWTHIAVVRSAGVNSVYQDGQLVLSHSQSFNVANGNIVVGSSTGTGFDFSGNIDEVRVTASARYTANFTPPTAAFPDA
jgi:hypothetical protein